MSFIATHLGITPGARVIEAGTGSGSFSHYLTRAVARNHAESRGIGWKGKATESRGQNQRNGRGRGKDRDEADNEDDGLKLNDSEEELSKKLPANKEEAEMMRLLSREPDAHVDGKEGRVWSFEFHAGRAVKAWNEFQDHGLFPTLSLRHRNVCKNGFGLQGVADAVFLDLPAPWEALGHAAKALRCDVAGRICCFSPCIEQVLKTVEAFRKGGTLEEETRWVDIETYECLNRTHLSIWAGPNGQTGNSSIQEAITRIKHVEERKGRRREAQIARVKKERLERMAQVAKEGEEVEEAEKGNEETNGQQEAEGVLPIVVGEKRKRDDGDEYREMESKPSHVDAPTVLCKDGKTLHRANVYARPLTEVSPFFAR
jgi:tRNA (adenine57-N1/adenine58-N1)-methyltransferase